jgi:putative tricarboxylic transport membrane protein
MRSRSLGIMLAGVTALALASCSSTTGGGAPEEGGEVTEVGIIVPADPGGGWDQTGRALSQVFTQEGILETAAVTNIGGAGGTVGLASLANESNPHTLMVTGLVMVGAVETNAAESRMEDTTPIARLTEEALVIVVPADSPYDTLEDLVDDIVENGQDVTVTGGSAGGADHILAGLLLEEAGLGGDEIPTNLNYIPNSGGGEAVSLLLGNNVSAGISGIGEFVEHVDAGTMRALAVSSPEQTDLLPDVPTIMESGYDLELTNWRGVLAPGSISDADRDALIEVVTELHESEAWTEVLETRGWADAFLAGDEFDSYLESNIAEVVQTLGNIGLVE